MIPDQRWEPAQLLVHHVGVALDHAGVVGGGIVGLAVARRLAQLRHGTRVTVFEKESRVGAHQTGHNSGVVHAGLYYRPGSLKAVLCRSGASQLKDYCSEHGIAFRELGKTVVAASTEEIGRLRWLERNARENGVRDLARLSSAELRDIEPNVGGHAALHSPHTAVVDFASVARQLSRDLADNGGEVLLRHEVTGIRQSPDTVSVRAGGRRFDLEALVVCAGLGTDRLAESGAANEVRIVPFRGEYYQLVGEARNLVRGLVYPVPDPSFPFLGVHLTRSVDDRILLGPNAVLALANEGYRWSDVSARDVAAYLRWPGFWRLAASNWRTGMRELGSSVSRHSFAELARRYVPTIRDADLRRSIAGVRAQAVDRQGTLMDDFVIERIGRVVVVRNAPSPAATSSLAIADLLMAEVP